MDNSLSDSLLVMSHHIAIVVRRTTMFVKVEVYPFDVPDNVRMKQKPGLRQDGFRPVSTFSLAQLDDDTLKQLCDDFVTAVYEKAGRTR